MYLPNSTAYQKRCVLLLLVLLVAACAAPSNSQAGLGSVTAQESPRSTVMPETLVDAPGDAQEGELLSDSYHECASANDGSSWGMQECVEAEFENQDARLNSAYRALMSKLPPDEKVKLKAEERRWIAEKESICSWDAESEGQAQRIAANICSLEKTAERAAYLEGKL